MERICVEDRGNSLPRRPPSARGQLTAEQLIVAKYLRADMVHLTMYSTFIRPIRVLNIPQSLTFTVPRVRVIGGFTTVLVFSKLRNKTRCGVECSEAMTITESQPKRFDHYNIVLAERATP